MPRRPPRDPKTVGSFSELRMHYAELWRELDDCKRNRGALQSTLASSRKGEVALREEKKVLKSKVALITKKAAAQKSFRETSGWSAGAIGSVTLIWAAFGEYGYPGPKWLFEHEVFYGAVCWVATTICAWAAKGFYGAD